MVTGVFEAQIAIVSTRCVIFGCCGDRGENIASGGKTSSGAVAS